MTTLREKMKQEMTLRGFSHGTQEQYLRAVVKLYRYYQQESPAKLNEGQIKAFLLSLLESKTYAPSTYNIIVHGLKFFYEVVLKKKMVAVELPRVKEPQKLPDILSQEEVAKIIRSTINIKHKAILMITYGAGLRASEVASLCVQDLDRQRNMMHIRQGKGNKDRYVLLSPSMLAVLGTYWRQCRSTTKDNPLLFLGQSGEALSASSVGMIYKQAKHKAGIHKKGGVHALRHAFATHALESGADLYTIKQLLGHASVSSTVRYLRMTEKTMKSISSPVEQLTI